VPFFAIATERAVRGRGVRPMVAVRKGGEIRKDEICIGKVQKRRADGSE